jgi:hypothetical protein
MHTPSYYRERAAYMNNLAHEASSPALRDSYLKLALEWEALAEKAERGKSEVQSAIQPDDSGPPLDGKS